MYHIILLELQSGDDVKERDVEAISTLLVFSSKNIE